MDRCTDSPFEPISKALNAFHKRIHVLEYLPYLVELTLDPFLRLQNRGAYLHNSLIHVRLGNQMSALHVVKEFS